MQIINDYHNKKPMRSVHPPPRVGVLFPPPPPPLPPSSPPGPCVQSERLSKHQQVGFRRSADGAATARPTPMVASWITERGRVHPMGRHGRRRGGEGVPGPRAVRSSISRGDTASTHGPRPHSIPVVVLLEYEYCSNSTRTRTLNTKHTPRPRIDCRPILLSRPGRSVGRRCERRPASIFDCSRRCARSPPR